MVEVDAVLVGGLRDAAACQSGGQAVGASALVLRHLQDHAGRGLREALFLPAARQLLEQRVVGVRHQVLAVALDVGVDDLRLLRPRGPVLGAACVLELGPDGLM